ncbi:MAG: asparagine synthase (glutamine-hydrolyzing) [Endomicrobiales bacterium]|nr:asparagine synthase (glutamine-hydrolyzing) [Endomicrobiales bacterium]
MCGIAGIIIKKGKIDSYTDKIKDMIKIMSYRGPDSEGKLIDSGKGIALGHKRLSIIDLSCLADQPMEINGTIIVYNGEIYNYRELKEENLSNENFKSTSDTEVLLRLYIKYGIDKTVNLLRGMFAFAIIDKSKDKVYLVRDHIGKKPLYILENEDGLFFSSEAKAFKVLDNKKYFELNDEVESDCLCYRFTEEMSPYKNIKMLKNGHYLEINLSDKKMTLHKYFEFTDLIDKKYYEENKLKSQGEIEDEFEKLLVNSVKRRMVADTEVASIASGGLDSSLITAIAHKINKIRMLHVNVTQMSEKYYAELLSKHINAELLIQDLDVKEIEDRIDNTIYHYEYPLVHPNSIGISMLARLARNSGIKVLLGGEGADELFGGYRFQKKYYLSRKIRELVGDKSIISKTLGLFTGLTRDYDYIKSYSKEPNCSERNAIKERFEKISRNYDFIENKFERDISTFLMSVLYEYLQPILLRVDKMGMMHSVEIRSPFLDLELMKFVLNLPVKYRMNLFKSKILLRKIAKKYIPKKIINRSKVGFPVPIPEKYNLMKNEHRDRNYVIYSLKILKDLYNHS